MDDKIYQSFDFWCSFGNIFPASVLVIKKTGEIVYKNNFFTNLSDFNSTIFFHFLDDECLKRINQLVNLPEKEKKIISDKLKIKEAKGKELFFTYYLFPLKDDLFSLVLNDNTEMNNEVMMLNNIINTVPDPIFVKDDQFRLLYLNHACAESWGLPASHIIGKKDDDFFPQAERDVFNKIDRRTFRTGKTTINEESFTRIKGMTRIISTKKSVFTTLTGNKILVGVSRDVTEINDAREYLKKQAKELKKQVDIRTKQLETKKDELEQAVEKLKSLNSDLDCFAHICCHELREPLRTISSFSKIVLDEYTNGKNNNIIDYLQIINQGATRMDKLIKSILEYSTNGLYSNTMSFFSSNDLILEVLDMMDHYIQERNAIVYFSDMPYIYADRLQILQLFQNLINNSIKFCTPETPPVIAINAAQKGKFTEFQIKDNGIGIAKKYHKEIFLPFKKFHSRAEGSMYGIGLSLCKKIIENHGGSIKLNSKENAGTTFKFLLPSQAISEVSHVY